MSQASKSHKEDSLGGHSKASQKPEPAHQYAGERTSTNPDEAKGGVTKKRPAPDHVGPRTPSEPDETVDGARFKNKKQHPGDAKEVPGAARTARNNGPHGRSTNADGSLFAEPKKKRQR